MSNIGTCIVEWNPKRKPQKNADGTKVKAETVHAPSSFYKRRRRFVNNNWSETEDDTFANLTKIEQVGDDQKVSLLIQESVTVGQISLVRCVAFMAKDEYDAAQVYIDEGEGLQPYKATALDKKVYDNINRVMGHRGKHPADVQEIDWVVTCLEEMDSFSYPHSKFALNCPHCHGFYTLFRPNGMPRHYVYPFGQIDVLEGWLNTRFASGQFEPPIDHLTGEPMPTNGREKLNSFADKRGVATLALIENSPKFLELIHKLPETVALGVLDRVFAARNYLQAADRRRARIKAVTAFVGDGVDMSLVNMAERPTSVDLMDATFYGDPSYWASLIKSYGSGK